MHSAARPGQRGFLGFLNGNPKNLKTLSDIGAPREFQIAEFKTPNTQKTLKPCAARPSQRGFLEFLSFFNFLGLKLLFGNLLHSATRNIAEELRFISHFRILILATQNCSSVCIFSSWHRNRALVLAFSQLASRQASNAQRKQSASDPLGGGGWMARPGGGISPSSV